MVVLMVVVWVCVLGMVILYSGLRCCWFSGV